MKYVRLLAVCQVKIGFQPYNKNMNKFAERLKLVLKTNNMTQIELARKIKMSQGIVNSYCTGEREPTLDVLMLISKELNESTDYLLGLED